MFHLQYPVNGTFTTKRGVEVDTPAQYFEADVFNLYGAADLKAVRRWTAGTGFQPVETTDGRGIGNLIVNHFVDSNLEPYREIVLAVAVDDERRVVPADNPYEYLAATLDPRTTMFVLKLLLDEQLPIDVGLEYFKMPKVPLPQRLRFDFSTTLANVSAASHRGRRIFDVRFPIEQSPDALEGMRSTEGFGGWADDSTAHGGLTRFNYIYRDVSDRRKLHKTHAVGRIFTDPQGFSFSPPGPGARFKAYRGTEFGTKLAKMRLRPELGLILFDGHWVLSEGWKPE
jgi:hypothetical protein